MAPDLATRYLGLELRSPLVASASPLTGDVDSLRELEGAGCAAVVLPSLFEEQITHEALEVDRILSTGADSSGEAATFFPELATYDVGPDRYLRFVEEAKAAVGIPVIGSLNGVSLGGWVKHARLIEDAGADAVELNVYFMAPARARGGADVEGRYLDLVAAVRAEVSIPLAVKVGPFFSSFLNLAHRLDDAGADGLVLFNRFYQPDLDLDTLEVTPRLILSTSAQLRLPLRWIGLLHGGVGASLAASGGVHEATDVVKVLLAGADVAMTTSGLLIRGTGHVAALEAGLRDWMADHGYESVTQMRGSVSAHAVPDPTAFERANYLQMLRSYSTPTG